MKFGRLPNLSAMLATLMMLAAPAVGQSGQQMAPNKTLVGGSVAALSVDSKSSVVDSNLKLSVRDVVLGSGGHVTFTVVGSSGQPMVGVTVSLTVESSQIAKATTNTKGQVKISGLKPGLHALHTGLTRTLVRFWPLHTAPPQAIANPAIVDSSDLVRGQYGYGAPMGAALLAVALTAAGVGIAVIGKNSGSNSSAAVVPASP